MHGSFIRFGTARETGLVNSIVDSAINPIVDRINFLAKLLGINVDLCLVGGDELVELGIEYSDNLGAFIVHDCVIFLVPEQRDGKPSGIIWFSPEIQVLDVFRTVQRIDLRRRVIIDTREGPSLLAHARGNNRDRDYFIETLEFSGDQRPRCPGASVRHVEMITVFFRRELTSFLD